MPLHAATRPICHRTAARHAFVCFWSRPASNPAAHRRRGLPCVATTAARIPPGWRLRYIYTPMVGDGVPDPSGIVPLSPALVVISPRGKKKKSTPAGRALSRHQPSHFFCLPRRPYPHTSLSPPPIARASPPPSSASWRPPFSTRSTTTRTG